MLSKENKNTDIADNEVAERSWLDCLLGTMQGEAGGGIDNGEAY